MKQITTQHLKGASALCWAESHNKMQRMTWIVKLDGNWNSLPQGQRIFLQLWTRVHDLGASVCVCAGTLDTESACDGGVCNWGLCANLVRINVLPQRVCRSQQCARLGQHVLASEQAQDGTAPKTN